MGRFKVSRIEIQSDRAKIFGHPKWDDYYVIASRESGANLKIGDEIEYSDGGYNFGWFKKKIEK